MEATSLNTSFYKEALIVLGAAGIVIPLFHRLHVSPVCSSDPHTYGETRYFASETCGYRKLHPGWRMCSDALL